MMKDFHYDLHPNYIALVTSLSANYALRYISLALISKWSFENRGPPSSILINGSRGDHGTSTESGPASLRNRLQFGLRTTMYPRKIGTPYEVKNVPHFSSRDPKYAPSRSHYIIRSAISLLATWMIIYLHSIYRPSDTDVLYDPGMVPLLTRYDQVTLDEILSRVKSTFLYWFIFYHKLNSFFGQLNLILGASGLSEVKFCRPVFGPALEAYSVRQFWR